MQYLLVNNEMSHLLLTYHKLEWEKNYSEPVLYHMFV